MKNFVKVNLYSTYFMSKRSPLAKGGKSGIFENETNTISTFIRLDAFVQIDDLEEVKVMKSEYDNKVVKIIKTSHCFLNRFEGKGLNGISTEIYLTEESYNAVLTALELQ